MGETSEKNITLMGRMVVVLLSISIIALMGIAFVNQFGQELRDTSAVINESLTLSNATAVNLANTFVQGSGLTVVANRTGQFDETLRLNTDYTLDSLDSSNAGRVRLINASYEGNQSVVSYNFLAATPESNSADAFSAGLAVFGTFAAVIALAIVGQIIVGLFA